MGEGNLRANGIADTTSQGESEMVSLPDGYQIAAYHFGAEGGPPVVLLHGGGVDSGMLSWRDTIPALVEGGYRVYAFDWPGYGQSPPAPVGFTQNLLIDVATGLFDAWHLEKASLVGISMGGGAAIGFTLAHPERVEKLALVGAYGLQDRVAAHFWSALYVRLPLMNTVAYALLRSSPWMMRETMKAIIRRPASLTDALLAEANAALRSPGAGEAFAQFQRHEMGWRRVRTCYMPQLDRIAVPTLIVHGTGDVGAPVKYAREAAQRIPNAVLHIVEGAGHWTQRDAPEEFNHVLLEFLRSR